MTRPPHCRRGIPVPAIPSSKGNYILLSNMESPETLLVGGLGRRYFPAGVYAYAGSAFGPGGLKGRLNRHLNPSTSCRWHLDYLKGRVRLVEIWWSQTPENIEHCWVKALMALPGAAIPVAGFGSSDCRCRSHLVHFGALPTRAAFRRCLATLPDDAVQTVATLRRSLLHTPYRAASLSSNDQ
ncbi:MAG: GIY-YIG nuclease family protein [Desulfobacterales bacterium]